MIHPLLLIGFGFLCIVVFLIVVWPNKGLYYRIERYRTDKHKVLVEDALKHIYHCEYKGIKSTLDSISGSLSIGGDHAARLVGELGEMGLITAESKGIDLTAEGRSYALRVIRIHRLWEKFLAEKTGLNELEWHEEAEYREHFITPKEANELAAQMGNPLLDPHGDPIPDAKGRMPESRGVPLSEIKEGEFARISHIEDEPNAVYSQLVAEGLYPGMKIRMIQKTKDRIKFEANGEECLLAPVVASNLTVVPIAKPAFILENFKSLSKLKPGEEATVLGISKLCRGQQRRRLLDFGFVPGSKIKAELAGAGGDPVAYKIKGTTVALRKNQADLIYINN